MTANQLLLNIRNVIGMLTSGDIPVKINGKEVMIHDVTLEGSNGDYWCDIKISEGKTDIPKEEYVQCGQTRIILYPQENN